MSTLKSNRRTTRILALISAAAFAGVVAVNGLANALPLNGVNTGTLSDELPNLFVPAGLTFSIWGLIYLLLAGYVAAAVREAWSPAPAGGTAAAVSAAAVPAAWGGRDAGLFIANAAANMAWIGAWHWRRVGTSLILMSVILGTLIALEVGSRKKLASGGSLEKALPGKKGGVRRFFLTVPLRVYLGWICVATIANVTALLVKTGWGGFGLDPRAWTVIVIIVGLALALEFSIAKRQIAAPLVVVWAYAGIVLKRVQTDPVYSAPVWIAAALAALILLISIVRLRIACPFRPKRA